MFTLDTNAIIYFQKDDSSAVKLFKNKILPYGPLYVSTITELELFSQQDLNSSDRLKIEDILSTLSIVPLDSRMARLAGEIRRVASIKTPDSAIAATALLTNSILVTRNIKDFKRVPGLRILKI